MTQVAPLQPRMFGLGMDAPASQRLFHLLDGSTTDSTNEQNGVFLFEPQISLFAAPDGSEQPKPDAELKPFDGWDASDKQFEDPEDSGGDVPAAVDGPYAAQTPAKQAGSTAPQDMLSPPSLGAATAIAEMCRASMSGPLAAAPSGELAEPRAMPAQAERSMITRPPPGAREREFAAGRIDEQQLEQGRARLEPFHEIARNLPQLAQTGTHRLAVKDQRGNTWHVTAINRRGIITVEGLRDFYVKYLFIAGVDRLSLAWGGGELVMRKGGLLSMEICPSPLKETPIKLGKRGRDDSDGGSGAEDEGRPRRAIKFKEDLDPELKAILERRPSAAQALLAPSEASYPPPSIGSQLLTAVPRRRTAEGPRRARKPVRVQRTNSDDHEAHAVSPDNVSADKDGPLTEASPAAAAPVPAAEHAAESAPTTSPPKPKLRGRFRRGGPAGRAGRFAVEEVPLTSGGRYVGGAVVLAAKVLTESDAKGRIILPRAMVEHNLGWFVGTYRSYTLSLRDQGGMEHTVLLNSWANGAGRRDDGRPKSRVYVLEKMTGVLAAHRIGEGAAIGLCLDENGHMFLGINSNQVRVAASSKSPMMGYCDYPKPPAGGETALLNERGPCTGRKPGCLLHNGHSGFCAFGMDRVSPDGDRLLSNAGGRKRRPAQDDLDTADEDSDDGSLDAPAMRSRSRRASRKHHRVEQPPPVQQPPPQPLQQQPQKPEPLLINGQETVKAAFASQQMIGGVAPGAKTPPPVVSSAVAAWIAATPTIAPVAAPSMEATKTVAQAVPQQVQRAAAPAAAPARRPVVAAAVQQQRAPAAAEPHAEEANSEWTAWLNELGYTTQ